MPEDKKARPFPDLPAGRAGLACPPEAPLESSEMSGNEGIYKISAATARQLRGSGPIRPQLSGNRRGCPQLSGLLKFPGSPLASTSTAAEVQSVLPRMSGNARKRSEMFGETEKFA